jgi:hypothetical protein
MRPDTDDAPAHVFPRVCRWRKRAISQPANEVLDIRKAFSHLRVSDVSLPFCIHSHALPFVLAI